MLMQVKFQQAILFIKQIKTTIRNIRKVSNRRPDVKAIYQYVKKNLLPILMKMIL